MTKVTNYRDPKYLERYEDVYFQLGTALDNPGNGLHQRKLVILLLLTIVEKQIPLIGIMPGLM